MDMSRAEIKGGALISLHAWLNARFDAGRVAATKALLTPEQLDALETTLPSSYLPVAHLDAFFGAVQEVVCPEMPRAFGEVAADSGRHVADDHLNGMFRAFLRICVSPQTVLEYQPRIWALYFRGIEVTVTERRRDGGSFTVRGLGSVRYMAPGAIGWLRHLFRSVATRDLVLVERSWEQGVLRADPLVFDVRFAP